MRQQILDLVRFRELLLNLVARDLNVRYKGTSLGFFWSLATPVLSAAVYYFLFTYIFKADIPRYPLFLLCGVFPWAFVSIALGDATLSVVVNAGLVRRAWFPRELLPLSPVLSGLLHLSATFALLLTVLAWERLWSPALVALPLLMLLNAGIVYGLALVASCAHAFFRDVHWIVGALTGLWFYASPVLYSADMVYGSDRVPEAIKAAYGFNPMVGILEAYRGVLLQGRLPAAGDLAVPAAAAAVLIGIGLAAYRRYSHRFAEEV